MKLQPIVYTEDLAAAVDWYGKVLGDDPSYRSDRWTSFDVDGAMLGVHWVESLSDRGRVELSLVATEPLEDIVARLGELGIATREGIKDEAFGRSFVIVDPDGTPVQVNEHD